MDTGKGNSAWIQGRRIVHGYREGNSAWIRGRRIVHGYMEGE